MVNNEMIAEYSLHLWVYKLIDLNAVTMTLNFSNHSFWLADELCNLMQRPIQLVDPYDQVLQEEIVNDCWRLEVLVMAINISN